MYYFLAPKIFKKVHNFLRFSGKNDKKLNIGLTWVNYALMPVKPEQEMSILTKRFWVLICR